MAITLDTIQIGPMRNGRQTITLPSKDKGAYIQCEVTPEQVDEYMSQRKVIENKASKRGIASIGIGTVVGGTIAALVMKNAKMLEKLALGGISGLFTGFLGALCFADNAQSKILKLNDEFIAQHGNQQ